MTAARLLEIVLPNEEILLLQRRPDTPSKNLLGTNDWHVNAAADEKELLRNHATIGREKYVGPTFVFRHIPILGGAVSAVTWDAIMQQAATRASKLKRH